MSEISRRRQVFTVTSGGVERTVTVEAGIYVPSSDESSITLTHTMGTRPIQCSIAALDRTQCNDGTTSYTYTVGGIGTGSNAKNPSSGWRAFALSGTGTGNYVEMYSSYVVFKQYASANPFRSGIEYVYEILWVS